MADRKLDAEITVEFNEAASRQSLNSGDSVNTLFGKIKKFFSDLKPVAFSGDAETVSGHTVAADVPALGYYYATCSTGLEKNIKEVTCEGFEIKEGARITICFTAGNGGTPPNATYILKINDDAGRPIAYNDWSGEGIVNMLTAKTSELCCGNQTWDFVYHSGRFLMTTFLGNYIIDDALNKNSTRCVQNKVIKAALDEKANVDDLPEYAKTTDVPAIKVNNAVNADTVDGVHIAVTNDGKANNLVAVFTSENTIHSISPANMSVGNATNAANAASVTSLRHETTYSDIFSTTLASTHGCWNKWVYVVGSNTDTSSTDYIANAPETATALWYEVLTGGRNNRAFQIAIGCYRHQRNMFIRYMHDGAWSEWNKISPAETATLQEYGVTPTLTNGTATAIAVSFNPQVVLLMNNGHIITGGYAITMGAKKFTVTPSSVSTMGTVAPNYIAFG